MAKQVLLKDLGRGKQGLFPKLIFDEDAKKLIIRTRQKDINGVETGKFVEYDVDLTDTIAS